MKNKSLYDRYAIQGWPSQFYTISAQDKYNAKIEKFCQSLPEGAKNLSECQRFILAWYRKYIFLYDVVELKRQSKNTKADQ